MTGTGANTEAALGNRKVECPRCGYDLSGVVDSWKESCPVEGVCSECGTAFSWQLVIDPSQRPWWFVETGDRLSLKKAVWTLLATWNPNAFWRSIRPETPVRLQRAIVPMLIGLALLLSVSAACYWGLIVLGASTSIMVTLSTASSYTIIDIVPFRWDGLGWILLGLALTNSWFSAFCLIFLGSLKSARIRMCHIGRIAIYGLCPVTIYASVATLLLTFVKLGTHGTSIKELPYWTMWPLVLIGGGWALIGVVYVVFWPWAAFKFYMNLKRALPAALLTGVAAALATAATFWGVKHWL